jgi:hypothetical protein
LLFVFILVLLSDLVWFRLPFWVLVLDLDLILDFKILDTRLCPTKPRIKLCLFNWKIYRTVRLNASMQSNANWRQDGKNMTDVVLYASHSSSLSYHIS